MGLTDQSPIQMFQKESPKLLKEAPGCQKEVILVPHCSGKPLIPLTFLICLIPSHLCLFLFTLGGAYFLLKIVTRMSS